MPRRQAANFAWKWRRKGGHCVVRFEGSFSVIKSGEISPLMEKVIRKQLGL